eukprot:TRINITY_DN972_c0_g1_i1.p1 TRINITY_DN972_c0_g1~~TRINITY_DN972_c0_g1_i1.p1  ORF type:complete len:205 (+),score=76.76 TRINITY_DN972_c0_g1_i1:161-775(+)
MTAPLIKIILLGDSCVGKTSLIEVFANEVILDIYKPTIGADFETKEIEVDKKNVILQMWDTAGTERFMSLNKSFMRGSDCCILVFDVTVGKTLDNIETWRDFFIDGAKIQDPSSFPFILVGNKIDSLDRAVDMSAAQEWCQRHYNCPYIESSALTNTNVEQIFTTAARLVNSRSSNKSKSQVVSIASDSTLAPKPTNTDSGGCC